MGWEPDLDALLAPHCRGFPSMPNWKGDPGADLEPAGGITYPVLPGSASGSPRNSWKIWLGRKDVLTTFLGRWMEELSIT